MLLPLFVTYISTLSALAKADLLCRPEGPILPKPTSLSLSPTFQNASAEFTESLNTLVAGNITAGWALENSSFSLAVVAWDDPEPVWEYHHLAATNVNGTKEVDKESQYLIGSISKVISDYVLLRSGVDVDKPVTEFLTSLNSSDSSIQWQNITLRMLASHLSGAPTNYGFSEYYFLNEVFLAYGLPPVEEDDYPPCGVTGLNGACSPQDLLDGLTSEYPVTAPMERPAYSNIAFTLFGLALEEYTGKNYSQLVQELVSEPLGLVSTFPSPGDDDKAVIPLMENTWGADYSFNAPGGGLVSSIADLSKFSHALLSRTLDLTPTEIDAWLKPASFAGGPYDSVGMPWEIFRPFNLTPAHPHTVTVYGKGGGAQGYRSQLDVVDEYGFALVVLTAGDMQAVTLLRDAMLATFVPAVDEVSREQAKQYERNYTSEESGVLVEATLSQDDDSLLLSSITRNNSDILTALTDIWTLTMGTFIAPVGPTVRLFPSKLTMNTTLEDSPATAEVWRLWPEITEEMQTDLPRTGLVSQQCVIWTIGDWVHYGGEPLDRVVVYKEEGEVVGFEVPFLRSGVLKAE